MTIRTAFFFSFSICGILSFLILYPHKTASANNFSGWYHGAPGYAEAIEEARNSETPMVMYFHTEWCKWSKKMNTHYLDSYEVDNFLSTIPKVEINPEKGSAEKTLSQKHNVTGYPTFLVSIPSLGNPERRVSPFKKGSQLSTDEFIGAVRKNILTIYNKAGYSFFQKKQFENAIKYYEMAINTNPHDAYAHYGKGLVHHTVAFETRNTQLLEEAEAAYMNALEIDPNHAGSQKGLVTIQKTMKKMGIR